MHSKVNEKAQTPHTAMEKSIRDKRKQVYIKPRKGNRPTESENFRSLIPSSFKCYFQSKRTNPPITLITCSTITQLKPRHDSLMSTIQYWLNQGPRPSPLTMQSFLTTYVVKGKSHVHLVSKQISP